MYHFVVVIVLAALVHVNIILCGWLGLVKLVTQIIIGHVQESLNVYEYCDTTYLIAVEVGLNTLCQLKVIPCQCAFFI